MNAFYRVPSRTATAHLIVFTATLLLCWAGLLHAQTFEWARQAVGDGWKHGFAIAVDDQGNSFVVGEFTGTNTTTPTPFDFSNPNSSTPSATLTPNGVNAFVAMYNASGTLQWAERISAGANGVVVARAVATWKDGNGLRHVYVAGDLMGTINQSGLVLSASNGGSFLVEYTYTTGPQSSHTLNGGTVLAATNTSSSAQISGIAVNNAGEIYACGTLKGPAMFSQLYITSSSPTTNACFVVHFPPSTSNWPWQADQPVFSTGGEAYATAIAVDGNNNAVITGRYRGAVNFPSGGSSTITLTYSGTQDNMFVARYDLTARFINAVGVPSTGSIAGTGVAVDGDNAYVVGTFSGACTIGSSPLSTVGSGTDFFLARYDFPPSSTSSSPPGQWMFAKSGNVGLTGDAAGNGVAIRNGKVYAAGTFTGTMNFGTTSTTLASMGNHDVFVAEFAMEIVPPSPPTIKLKWAQRAGNVYASNANNHYDQATGIAADPASDAVYLAGEFGGTAEFVGTPGLGYNHFRNVFAAKLNPTSNSISGTVTANNPPTTNLPAANQIVKVTTTINGTTLPADYVATGPDGTYIAYVPEGCTTKVELLHDSQYWTCSPAWDGILGTQSGVDFTLNGERPTAPDVRIQIQILSTENAITGQQIRYLITYKNVGNAPANGVDIKLAYDSKLQPSAQHHVQTLGDATITDYPLKWTVNILNPLECDSIVVQFDNTAGLTDGTALYSQVSACQSTCRSSGIGQMVVNPSDPNMKTVYQPRVVSIVKVLAGLALDYTVEFFNNGAGPANKVYVEDTLSTWLDVTSINDITTTNWWPAITSRSFNTGNKILKYDFTPANLPPISQAPGHIGFVSFSVPVKKSTPIGTWIRNRAAVTFAEVPTTLQTNVVENCVGADFTVSAPCVGAVTQFTTLDAASNSYLPSWANPQSIRWNFGDGSSTNGERNVEHVFTRPGPYWVTLTFTDSTHSLRRLCDEFDSVFTITKLVTVDSVPAILYTRNGDTFTAVSAAAYRWYRGAVLQATTQSFTPTQPGTYQLCITTAGGCEACTTFVYTSASLPTERALPALAIHPNPGSDLFVVELGQAATTAGQCVVINALGAVVRRTAIEPGSSTATLDMRGFPSGAYLARIAFGATVTTLGFVVQR